MTSSGNTQAISFQAGHHRFAWLLASLVLLLIIAGALVTSNNAGLAVPDWPTSFGHYFKIPPMVGGVKYEHGHRMLAQFIGLLTIIFAVYTYRVEKRPWLRKLAFWNIALVVIQGVLGGLTVKFFLPWYISTAHAMVAQTFFAVTVLMALYTSRLWLAEPTATPAPQHPAPQHRKIRTWAILSICAIYLQLFFGAAFRHSGMSFMPHMLNAILVAAILLYTAILAITQGQSIPGVRSAGMSLMHGLFLQLLLGFGAYITRVVWGSNAVQPLPSMVATTVAHVATGAILLAAAFVLAALLSHNSEASMAHAVRAGQQQTVNA